MTTIIVTHEDNEVDEFEFESGLKSISIGRRSSNDVCVPNLSVSGKHASIVFENSSAWLEDLKSTNGSYINGVQITRQEIQDGDEIILGKIRLTYISNDFDAAATSNPKHTGAESAQTATQPPTQTSAQVMGDNVKVAPKAPVHIGTPTDLSANQNVNNKVAELEGDTKLVSPKRDENSEKPPQDLAKNSSDSVEDEASFARDASLFDQVPAVSNGAVAARPAPSEVPHPLEGVDRPDASSVAPMHELDSTPVASKGAVIEIKNGAKSGQILPIDKPVTTLGRPGIQIAAIMRKPDGYFLMHIESDDSVDRPTLNQDAIGDEPVLLHSGDELNVAGIDVEFMLS